VIEARAQIFASILTALSPILGMIPNEISYDETKGFELKLSGFYKDGQISIRDAGWPQLQIIIEGRYNVLSQVLHLENLLDTVIDLQVERFRHWNEVKPETAPKIDNSWLPVLIQYGRVKPETTVTYVLT
jgi:hypothetical protein